MGDLASLAPDLTKDFPRGPHDKIGGYVVVARTLDKCRAALSGTNGEYHFDCPLDNFFFSFAEITADAFKAVVETGATDDEVGAWIQENAKKREPIEIIKWNNEMRFKRISEMPDPLQEFLEGYIPEYIPSNKRVNYWFDVYDIEENRI